MTATSTLRIAVLIAGLLAGGSAVAAEKQKAAPGETPARAALIQQVQKLEPRSERKVEPERAASPAEKAAERGFEQAAETRRKTDARSRIGAIETSPSAIAERMRAVQETAKGQERNDPAKAREQARNALPIRPPAETKSPFARPDPVKSRQQAFERLRDRATGDLKPETIAAPDPMAPVFPVNHGVPGLALGRIEQLKATTRRPGSGSGPQPYDGASLAKGKRPFFNLQHGAGGQGMWRCTRYCSENGYVEGELVDTQGLPQNAVRDDVSDMTTTEKLCRQNPKLCEEAGRSDRRPGENDEEYWDRKAKEAYAARKKRENDKLDQQASADCSKAKSRSEKADCEIAKHKAKEELERRRKEAEEKRKQAEADKKKKSAKDCAVSAGPGSDCDSIPEDELVNWHRETQRKQLEAARGPVYTGSGNVDPERGPRWHEGLTEVAVEILGVDDPPEDEANASQDAPDGNCAIAPGTGAIDYGSDHPDGGNPACKTDTPSFEADTTLDLEDVQEDEEKDEDADA